MPINYNSNLINEVIFNGVGVQKVIFNGVTVFDISGPATYDWSATTKAVFDSCSIKKYAVDNTGEAGPEILPTPTAAGWGGRIEYRDVFPPEYAYFISVEE